MADSFIKSSFKVWHCVGLQFHEHHDDTSAGTLCLFSAHCLFTEFWYFFALLSASRRSAATTCGTRRPTRRTVMKSPEFSRPLTFTNATGHNNLWNHQSFRSVYIGEHQWLQSKSETFLVLLLRPEHGANTSISFNSEASVNIHSWDVFKLLLFQNSSFPLVWETSFFRINFLFSAVTNRVFLLAVHRPAETDLFREILIFSKTPFTATSFFFCYGKWFFLYLWQITLTLFIFTIIVCWLLFLLRPSNFVFPPIHHSGKSSGVEYTLRHATVPNFVILNGTYYF